MPEYMPEYMPESDAKKHEPIKIRGKVFSQQLREDGKVIARIHLHKDDERFVSGGFYVEVDSSTSFPLGCDVEMTLTAGFLF